MGSKEMSIFLTCLAGGGAFFPRPSPSAACVRTREGEYRSLYKNKFVNLELKDRGDIPLLLCLEGKK
jgi:hypothetical protein